MIRDLERLECGHGDDVAARHIGSLAMALAYVRAGRSQELVREFIACVGIANAPWLTEAMLS
jgi:hypothetical protein